MPRINGFDEVILTEGQLQHVTEHCGEAFRRVIMNEVVSQQKNASLKQLVELYHYIYGDALDTKFRNANPDEPQPFDAKQSQEALMLIVPMLTIEDYTDHIKEDLVTRALQPRVESEAQPSYRGSAEIYKVLETELLYLGEIKEALTKKGLIETKPSWGNIISTAEKNPKYIALASAMDQAFPKRTSPERELALKAIRAGAEIDGATEVVDRVLGEQEGIWRGS